MDITFHVLSSDLEAEFRNNIVLRILKSSDALRFSFQQAGFFGVSKAIPIVNGRAKCIELYDGLCYCRVVDMRCFEFEVNQNGDVKLVFPRLKLNALSQKRRLSVRFSVEVSLLKGDAQDLVSEIQRALSPIFNVSIKDQADINIRFVRSIRNNPALGEMKDYNYRKEVIIYLKPEQKVVDDQIIQTVIHEVGHALNLRHPFNDDQLRKEGDGISVMDYIGGSFKFSPVEMTFLALETTEKVLPGTFFNIKKCYYHNLNWEKQLATCATQTKVWESEDEDDQDDEYEVPELSTETRIAQEQGSCIIG